MRPDEITDAEMDALIASLQYQTQIHEGGCNVVVSADQAIRLIQHFKATRNQPVAILAEAGESKS